MAPHPNAWPLSAATVGTGAVRKRARSTTDRSMKACSASPSIVPNSVEVVALGVGLAVADGDEAEYAPRRPRPASRAPSRPVEERPRRRCWRPSPRWTTRTPSTSSVLVIERVLACGHGSRAGARSSRLRRRQPLLRGARRLHPAPAGRASGPAACSGPRSRARSTTWSAARSAGRWPTPRSTRSPSRAACSEYFRGNPNNVDVLALLKDSEPIRRRVPRARSPAPRSSTSRASPAASCTRPSGCSTRRS